MYDDSTMILACAAALLLGALIGILVSRQLSPAGKKQRDLERNLDRLLQQQKDYQHEVAEHFTDTAKLLNNLAESYRDVHNHLAAGASALCDDHGQTILQKMPDASLAQLSEEPDLANLQQPLDSAPKSSPYQTGMLNEEFGLEKKPQAEEAEDLEIVGETEKA